MNASFGWVLGIAVLTLVGLAISFRELRNIISLWRTPLRTINALPPQGLVKVTGRAVQATTTSPISRTQCLVWKAKVVDVKGKGLSETLYKGSSFEPFEISDPTGTLVIRPKGADLSLKHVRRDNSNWLESLGSESRQAMDRLGIDTRNWLGGNKNLEVSESYLSLENPIYVLGDLNHSEGRAYIKTGRGPFIISDRTESELLFDLYTWVVLRLALTLLFGWVILHFVLQ
jgi:E3 Ubiquitin ligase